MIELIPVVKNTGLFTTVGGPVCIYCCIARVRGNLPLGWYFLVPAIQAYLLTGVYFAIFGPRIITTDIQTFLYLFLGSHLLTSALCIVVFLTESEERPRRKFPWDLERILVALCVYPFFMTGGVAVFFAVVTNDYCDGSRCEAAQLWAGRLGFTGTLFLSSLSMGMAAQWVNFICYVYGPYVPPRDEGEQA